MGSVPACFKTRNIISKYTLLRQALPNAVPYLNGIIDNRRVEVHYFQPRYFTRPGLLITKCSQLLFVFRSALHCLSLRGEVI